MYLQIFRFLPFNFDNNIKRFIFIFKYKNCSRQYVALPLLICVLVFSIKSASNSSKTSRNKNYERQGVVDLLKGVVKERKERTTLVLKLFIKTNKIMFYRLNDLQRTNELSSQACSWQHHGHHFSYLISLSTFQKFKSWCFSWSFQKFRQSRFYLTVFWSEEPASHC